MQIQFLTYYQLYNEGVVRRQQLPHYQKNIATYLKNELCTKCIKTEIQKKKKINHENMCYFARHVL